jgi:transposase
MSQTLNAAIAVVGIDIGKNSFHIVGHDERGAIVLRQKWSRGQVEARFANMPPCLIGMEACVGAHHLSRKLNSLGDDARLMPAKYVRPYSKGQKNNFRDAEAIAEAVQRPTMKFVATKTADQLDLQALHRVRERLVSQRTGIINQIRAFLLERGVAVRQGLRVLRAELPRLLATPPDVLSPRMVRIIENLTGDWRRLDERVEGLSSEIQAIARQDSGCERLMSVPGIGPIISSAMVAAIGAGDAFCARGRHQAAYLVQAGSTSFLLDCGATTLAVLQRTPSLIPAIDTILISHLHGDHFAGIPFLLLHYTYDRPRRRALRIAGPPGTEERVWSLFRAMYQDAWRQPLPFTLEFIEMPPGVSRTIDTIGVEPFRVPHQENEVSLGLTVNVEGRRILYSGDTGWTEELVARSENTDLFICECCFFETRLNAAYLGRYYLPGASIEAMYDATKQARLRGQWIEVVSPQR